MTRKVKAVLSTAALATVFMVLPVPAVFAQRNNGTFVGRQVPPQRLLNPTQNIHILPMTNPIAPMGNPIAPMVTPPFVRYSDGPPTVVNPEPPRGRRGNSGRGRDVVFVPVAVPYYYPPEYFPEPEPPPPTIPGQLPNSPYNNQESTSFDSRRDVPRDEPESTPAVSATVAPVFQPEVNPEQHPVVHKPRPNRVVVPPVVGTSRADVIALFGKPWGIISVRGQETLYFDGLTVVFVDGRVLQTR